ncbi:cell division control protein 14 [Brettanomyces nanus]|uniref:Tyrosine-protein phosphatase CDC14 n=1 Tax=Eeniella nana TaxID=13502 RepID=A0A875S3I9_EENNA|nr:cell division control protein 14 [Brettanomyces nanus]QPG75896.1 cell division control protein 14 [Brettanomyces nanus]
MHRKVKVDAIEFLKNKVYLGAYDNTPENTDQLIYFTVEEALPYNAFHLDFGPLHIGHLYRFAVALHNILNDPENGNKAVIFYSSQSPNSRANAACLLCCYLVLVQDWAPHQVLQPIAQMEHPFMPFRDAGYSRADFELTIQDVVYGIWRAKERGMVDITNFNLEEYEQYERVDQGDFNVISNDFVAFASPKQSRPGAPLNEPFRKVLQYFVAHDVQLVVRLNSHLYDKKEFEKRGINHIDMIFEDGTCPTMELVQKFIGASETVISNNGKIAVHCKAGLGRTGCLIGAYLIYTHGFTASECIGYMRMMRPGMVVGPQQHWLYLHQNEFRDWRHTMVLDTISDSSIGGLFSLISLDLYKSRERERRRRERLQHASRNSRSTEMDEDEDDVVDVDDSIELPPSTPLRRREASGQLKRATSNAVPIENPGQPRKYVGADGRFTNSDEEQDEGPYNSTANTTVEIGSPKKKADVGTVMTLGKENRYSSKKIGNHSSPVAHHRYPQSQFYRKITTTTTTTTIASSPPPTRVGHNADGGLLKVPKQRAVTNGKEKSSRIGSIERVLGKPGVRKVSGKRYTSGL